MQKDILFIDATVKSREKYLLGAEKLYRIIESNSYDEGLKLLKEYGFGRDSEKTELSDLIYAEEENLIAFKKEYAPKGGAVNYLLLPYDFFNAEALFKCEKLGLDKSKMLSHQGLLTVSELEKGLNGEELDIFEISEAYKEAEGLFNGEDKTPTGAEVSTVFTRRLFKAYKRLAKDKLLKGFWQKEIDFKNVSAALRSESEEEYAALKIDGGSLKDADDSALLSKDADKIRENFKGSYLSDFIVEALKGLEGAPLVSYEKLVDSFLVKTLKETRFFNRGIEPYLLYCLYRKADIKNARLVMIGLKNGADKTLLKEKLREAY